MSNLLVILIVLYACSYPVISDSKELLLDTAVQIKTGILMLNGVEINGDIFSWHEHLNWIPHEKAWYLLVGWVYKNFEVPGLMLLSSLINIFIMLPVILVSRVKDKASTVSCVLSILLIMKFGSNPITSIRPHMLSMLSLGILILSLLYYNDKIIKCFIFMLSVLLISLFHGGTIMLPFMVFIVYTIIDMLFDKNLKSLIINILSLILGFGLSIIVFGGFDGWTYLGGQSVYPSIMNLFVAYKPLEFTIPLSIMLIISIIGMCSMEHNKITISKIAYLGMFIVACTIYARMVLYLSIVLLICLPKSIDCFTEWVFNIFNLNPVKLNDKLKIIIIKMKNALAILMIFVVVFFNALYCDYTNIHTINDAASVNAYDNNMISFIKEKGYNKIYNDFNIGTWLLFNDVKVSLDNRVDPYLTTYDNAEDHFHKEYSITNLTWLNDYCERYNPDCLIFYYNPDASTIIENEESYTNYDKMTNFINEIDKYESNRFKKVYENTVTAKPESQMSSSKGKLTWVIYEYV